MRIVESPNHLDAMKEDNGSSKPYGPVGDGFSPNPKKGNPVPFVWRPIRWGRRLNKCPKDKRSMWEEMDSVPVAGRVLSAFHHDNNPRIQHPS
eukprot:scaffold874_cov126-Cylindrotheca_fusiformis.AAC.7